MNIRDLIYEIRVALAANKARSALTTLGIVIGIAAVVTLTSLIAGMEQEILSDLGADQSRVVYVYSMTKALTTDDLDYVEDVVSSVEVSAATLNASGEVSTPSTSLDYRSIQGVMPEFMEAVPSLYKITNGRTFMESDNTAMRQVAIVGTNTIKQLFGSEKVDVLGRNITIGSDTYQIVGIQESAPDMLMGSGADILIPFKTAQYRLVGNGDFYNFVAVAKSGHDTELVKDDVLRALDKRYPSRESDESFSFEMQGQVFESPDFMGYTQKEITDSVKTITNIFSILAGSVAGISLLVGGIGIMNMMLTSVTERIREIGLRKAVGARARDITRQFLGESIVLCVLGGIAGLILGYLSANLIAALIPIFVPDLNVTPAITPGIALVAFGVSALTGIVFGYYPARNAAKLDPVESLRHQ